jgi:mono/diheme cytochrome c family protein
MKKILILSLLVVLPVAVRAADASDNWQQSCARCHGADGAGNTKVGKKLGVKDYTDATVQGKMTDAEMLKAIKEGVTVDNKEKMKSFKDTLSDSEAGDLVAYIRKFKK